jgi:hypothetical protein
MISFVYVVKKYDILYVVNKVRVCQDICLFLKTMHRLKKHI